MKKIKLASPLFILRQESEKDLFAVLERIKELGFDGVEFLGFFGKPPGEIRRKLDEVGLEALGNHVDYFEFIKDPHATIAAHKEIGCKYITVTGLPKEKISDADELSKYISNVTKVGTICREEGVTLLYHNHDQELRHSMQDKFLLEVILDSTAEESLSLEPDLGWMAIGGADPEYFLDKYKNRCPIIHLKDFYAENLSKIGDVSELNWEKGDEKHSFFEFRPTGYGIANTPALLKKALLCDPEWIVADHDFAYDRDSYYDLKVSLEYIKNLLVIHGNDSL